ncbi:DUF5931 domain-containing protein, partial [Actinoallomurus acaciae]
MGPRRQGRGRQDQRGGVHRGLELLTGRAAPSWWRASAAFRLATLVYAAALILRHRHGYAHPVGGLLALALMAGWTALATVVYARPALRRRGFVVADVLVAVVLVLGTRWVDTGVHIDHGAPTLPV